MALHKIIEKHKVSILGQEITYTNNFLKHIEGTSYGIKPQSSLISYSSKLFKYDYVHPYLGPTLQVVDGKKYLLPMWKEVHPQTTYNDINWIKPESKKVEPEKNTWKFESSSAPGTFYIVRQSGLTLTCNCSGFYRAKDRNKACKHVQEVRKQLNK
jgi:hypothetical protein